MTLFSIDSASIWDPGALLTLLFTIFFYRVCTGPAYGCLIFHLPFFFAFAVNTDYGAG